MNAITESASPPVPHRRWVKASHWIVTLSFLLLAFSGFEILMVHPRLYWGEVGNELTPALLELPISRNHQRDTWEESKPFFEAKDSPVSAARTFDELMFNQNGWGRSLHFLAAWLLIVPGIIYLIIGVFSGHFRNYIWPKRKELTPASVWRDMKNHLRMQIAPATGGPDYGLLQKLAYVMVIFLALPLAVVTGLTMSPAITAAYPFLLKMFGGYQSARTIHFFTSLTLELFLFMHLAMIIKTGFTQQIRYMTLGK
ncbi:MAG: cytochrome b/b6 domain-containing protein [Imperialibacter sp.]|uniref:cytochrome b/b6 domain-containing protein n=1 Tax=Imperialibacter sp. TaxID=2038411 RepID=UPI0032EF8516